MSWLMQKRFKRKVPHLPLLNSGRVELLDVSRLRSQLAGLERRTSRGGRESIDHAPGASSHDDLINAACGALVNATRSTRGGMFHMLTGERIDEAANDRRWHRGLLDLFT